MNADNRYTETFYVKRESNSETEKVVVLFDERVDAFYAMRNAIDRNDVRVLIGSDFPKEVAKMWQ